MKTVRVVSLLLVAALSSGSLACDFHGGAFGMNWRDYDEQEVEALIRAAYGSKSQSTETTADAKPASRPVFSSSAARAADTAKERVSDTDSETKDEGAQP